jgi:hypothetical protein
MSQLFDLNVSNYSLKELLNFFGVDKNDDAASVDRSCNDLKKKIQADPKLGPVTKGKIHDFLNKAVDRLSQSRNATKELFESSSGSSSSSSSSSGSSSSSSGSDGLTAATITAAIKASAPAPGPTQFMQLKNDVQEHGDNFLITRPSEQLGIAGNFKNGKTALTGAPPGIVNPVAMATIKRALNVDTRFRSNYYSSKSTDFVFNIPYKFENVTSMSVATYELPLTYYAISQQYENNCIIFQWKSAGVDYYDNQYTLLIPDGNYNASFQSGNGSPIESAINGILKGTAMVQQTGLAYTVDRTSGRSIFACNSATDASGNVFPYDPSLTSSSFDMTTPCLTQTLHMSTSAYAPDVLHANMTVSSLNTLTFALSAASILPIPEVILANHSEESAPGTGGVGLLIGFPSDYFIVDSVTITNTTTNTSFTITGPPTLTGYYVFFENNYSSGFWPGLSNPPYENVVQVQQNSGMCGGLVFGNNSLEFTYVISGSSTTIKYTTPSGLNITDGYQYQEYNGQPPFNPPADFQWGGTGGSQSWGTQTGTGTQTYAQWLAVSGNYKHNSIYKFLYPYSTLTSPSSSNSVYLIWNNHTVQACSTELYFSLNDSCGDPIDLSSYANSTLTITDGTNTQTFHVSTVVNTGPGDYWTVTVSDGIGFNITNGAQIQVTFTKPLTSPPSPFPSTGAVIWNDSIQACATELYFSPNDSCGPINLSPYTNSTLTITDGTNVQTFNVSSVVDTGPGNYWTVSVSNGMGFNIANGAQIQVTFTKPLTSPPSPFPSTGAVIWNNTTQSFSTKIYFSANDANGNPVDLSGFDANKLSITDGVITQTFDVSAVNSSGSPIVYWEVDVFNGLGPNMPVNVPVDATFTRPVPTGPPTASGVPSGNVWWNDVVQAFSTILYFSADDSLSPPGNVDLSTFQNSKLTITDGTNTQTFSVSSITNAGLGSNNYWTVNVSNGAGLNMANCADIKATFTTTPVHTPFTGSMRIVFNARAGIDRNVTSSVTTATTNSSFQSDTRPLPLFLGWQLGYRTAVYELGGGTDSAGSTSPGIPQSAVSEGVCLITGPQYVFLCIDDYNNNVNNYYASAYGSSTIAPNIIARLNIKQQINSAGAYGVVSGESLSTSLTYSREYFGPVDIQRIRITLVDDFGRVLDLNNMDWSFALMFECVYSSSMA